MSQNEIKCPTCNTNAWKIFKTTDYSKTQDVIRFECSKCKFNVHILSYELIESLFPRFTQKYSDVIYDGELVSCPVDGSETWELFCNWDGEYLEVKCPTPKCYCDNSAWAECECGVILKLIDDDKPID